MKDLQKSKSSKLSMLLLVIFILITSILNTFLVTLPEEIKIIEGKEQKLEFKVPMTLQLCCKEPFFVNGNYLNEKLIINLKEPLILKSSVKGTYDFEFRLLGFIPLKKIKVHVLPETRVVPGGHSLGVKLRPNGVIVVGFASITDENGLKHQPAQEAGIQIGDIIVMVNNQKIFQAEELAQIIDNQKSVILTVKRNDKIFDVNLNPVKNNFGLYQIGLWVRDITAGVGTLTFYDPKTGFYGALGHIISDADTGKIIEVGEGEIIRARVSSISPGKKNQPGEKRGVFINEDKIIGNIIANTPYGIFGKAYQSFENPYYTSLPVATVSQVHEGHAKILTVVEDEKIQEYDIEIQKIIKQSSPNGKGMIIKITDEELIAKTGGIIQGMSGSPIIQDGYIVGAVTHVFVNDPTKGYGIFIEWMLNEVNDLNFREKV
ncbi:SpoIVB peptidase [Tepidanaerobacter acetatoxydans]|uniref:SpoIVB peptidase n=1 Tax=Tepidanaerobacter acetatoxydans TaxID=499229 RepID=UPI0026F0BCA6|nr:SpoIVB peptidase [Tepidanaerobacter acetatoxydans]